MISIYDLDKLTPEERRDYDLQQLVGNRFVIRKYTAEELLEKWSGQFDYTLEEIQTEINRREMK